MSVSAASVRLIAAISLKCYFVAGSGPSSITLAIDLSSLSSVTAVTTIRMPTFTSADLHRLLGAKELGVLVDDDSRVLAIFVLEHDVIGSGHRHGAHDLVLVTWMRDRDTSERDRQHRCSRNIARMNRLVIVAPLEKPKTTFSTRRPNATRRYRDRLRVKNRPCRRTLGATQRRHTARTSRRTS